MNACHSQRSFVAVNAKLDCSAHKNKLNCDCFCVNTFTIKQCQSPIHSQIIKLFLHKHCSDILTITMLIANSCTKRTTRQTTRMDNNHIRQQQEAKLLSNNSKFWSETILKNW